MASTTIKLSVETRDRLKAWGGDTYEDTIIEALDLLEAEQFWRQADIAAEALRKQTPEQRRRLTEAEADVDAPFDGLE